MAGRVAASGRVTRGENGNGVHRSSPVSNRVPPFVNIESKYVSKVKQVQVLDKMELRLHVDFVMTKTAACNIIIIVVVVRIMTVGVFAAFPPFHVPK